MTNPEPAGYAEASAELDEILAALDGDDLDVDDLADRVARAAELIQFCRARIDSARVNVQKIVADFDHADPTGSNTGTDVAESPGAEPT